MQLIHIYAIMLHYSSTEILILHIFIFFLMKDSISSNARKFQLPLTNILQNLYMLYKIYTIHNGH